jgi:hypothetical protein
MRSVPMLLLCLAIGACSSMADTLPLEVGPPPDEGQLQRAAISSVHRHGSATTVANSKPCKRAEEAPQAPTIKTALGWSAGTGWVCAWKVPMAGCVIRREQVQLISAGLRAPYGPTALQQFKLMPRGALSEDSRRGAPCENPQFSSALYSRAWSLAAATKRAREAMQVRLGLRGFPVLLERTEKTLPRCLLNFAWCARTEVPLLQLCATATKSC